MIAFALGSIGAFLPFEWPPLLRNIVLGYLVAFLFLRLSLVIGRFLLSPEVERFRIIPVTTPQARFWYLRLALVRRMVRVRLHHRRTVQPSGRLKKKPARSLPTSLVSACSASAWKASGAIHGYRRPAKSHQHLAALRLLRRTLAPVGRGSHAALLACDGRGRPSHGDQADATLGQPHPPPTRRSRPGPRSVLHPGHHSPQPSGRRPGTRSPRHHDHRRRHSAQLRLGHRPDRTFRPQHPADAASARRLERHRDRADRRLRVAPHQGGHRPQANPDP